MSQKQLTDALAVVQRELAAADHLETADVEKLRTVMRDIEAVLDESSETKESLSQHVSNASQRFEESHPVLTETLGSIADILQQMGI
ncbi:DUF4404 family protein [Rhodopirellula sp.]|nr:DUF4404 family protein [Rubripirellula sp.]MDB4477164.1 DUF4404 family protein [Rhodopirellula sp.]MDB4624543.1 DUF4404 family protein [Rubripirellula sp.]